VYAVTPGRLPDYSRLLDRLRRFACAGFGGTLRLALRESTMTLRPSFSWWIATALAVACAHACAEAEDDVGGYAGSAGQDAGFGGAAADGGGAGVDGGSGFGGSGGSAATGGGAGSAGANTGGAAGSGGANTGGVAGSAASGGSGGGSIPVTLSNTSGCTTFGAVNPDLPSEAGHFAAAALAPFSYPVTISEVTYWVSTHPAKPACTTGLAHRADVFASATAKPPASPSAQPSFQTFNVPADLAATSPRKLTLPLSPPIVLTSGQRLIVSVQLATNAAKTQSLCVEACADTGGISGVNWWSNSAAEPYAWADWVTQFGIPADMTAQANGVK
jgi:hypothetical protein